MEGLLRRYDAGHEERAGSDVGDFRGRGRLVAVVIGASLTLLAGVTGCTGVSKADVPVPSSSATPTASADPPDVSIQRTFALSDGSTEQGCLTLTVKPDPSTADRSTADNAAEARAIAADPRWRTEPVALSEVPAADLTKMKDRGETEGVILTGVLKDHIQAAIQQAGVDEGIVTSGFVGCR